MHTRKPSIHITEDKLQKIMEDMFEDLPDFLKVKPDAAKQILIRARKESCDNRLVSISNEKVQRDIKKILVANKGDTNLMSTVLYSVRKSMKHKGIQRIKEGTKDWKKVKEITELAIEFCNDFEIESKREGFITYVKMGLRRISSPRNLLDKLVKMYEIISLMYEAQMVVNDDTNKTESLNIHDRYVSTIAVKTGIVSTYDNDPINYVHFIRVREITDKYNVPIDIYLEAQFDGLEWTEGYPTPSQLTTEKAIDRLNKYMFKNKIKIKVDREEPGSKGLSDMLKKIKDGNYNS